MYPQIVLQEITLFDFLTEKNKNCSPHWENAHHIDKGHNISIMNTIF